MTSRERTLLLGLLLPVVALSTRGEAQSTNTDATSPGYFSSAATPQPVATPENQVATLLRDAYELMSKGKYDEAMTKVNAAMQIAPANPDAYGLRGSIYTEKKQWDLATQDFQKILQLTPDNAAAKFNLAEVLFQQKLYDQARTGFLALEKDPNLGDLSAYKVFLCDLLAGHEDMASKELDDFAQVGSHPSYYFSKAAWALVHKKPEDARDWLTSAVNIYAPQKIALYSSSLRELGYLPLPPPPEK